MRVIELFAGIGACSKALRRLGIDVEIVDAVEIDKYAIKSFNAVHGTNFDVQDIKEWDKDFDNIDLITHGSPCQDFSLAGKQAGGDVNSGTRSSLMYETIRIVGKIRPKYVLWENVKNLLSKNHKHNFDAYISTMEALGYTSYYKVLNAKDYGIPQNRERVYTVSIRKDIEKDYNFNKGIESKNKIKVVGNYMPSGHDASRIVDENGLAPTVKENHGTVTAVLQKFEFPKGKDNKNKINRLYGLYNQATRWGVYDKEGLAPTITASMGMGGGHVPMLEETGYRFPEKENLEIKLKDLLEDEVEEKYYLSDKQIEKIKNSNFMQEKKRIQEKEYCDTLLARDFKDPKCVRIGGIFDTETQKHQAGSVYDKNGLCPTLDTMQGGWRQPCVEENEKVEDRSFVEKHYDNFVAKNGYVPNMFNPYNESEIKDVAPTQSTQCGSTTSSATVLLKSKDKRLKKMVENTNFVEGEVLNMDLYNQTTNKDISQCLTEPHHNSQRLFDGYRIRKLTPKECWRLMGFDDSDFEKTKSIGMSDTQLYKQAGNSIVVNVLEKIFENLF